MRKITGMSAVFWIFFQTSAHFVPIHARHHDVEEDEVRLTVYGGEPQSCLPLGGDLRPVRSFQERTYQSNVLRRVIHDQNGRPSGAFIHFCHWLSPFLSLLHGFLDWFQQGKRRFEIVCLKSLAELRHSLSGRNSLEAPAHRFEQIERFAVAFLDEGRKPLEGGQDLVRFLVSALGVLWGFAVWKRDLYPFDR